MAYLILPSRRTRQPQGVAQLGGFGLLADGISACFTGVDPGFDLVNGVRFLPSGSPTIGVGANGRIAITTTNAADYDGWYAPQQTSGSQADKLYNVTAPPLTLFVVGNSSNQNIGCGIGRCNGSASPAWSVGFWAGSNKGAHGNCSTSGGDVLHTLPPTVGIDTSVGYHTAVLVVSPTTTTVYCDGFADQTDTTPSGNFTYQYSDKYRCLSVGGGYKFAGGNFALAGMLRRAWTLDLVQEFHRNPWQIFAPDPRRIYFGVSGGAGVYELDAQPGGYTVSGTAATLARGIVLDAQPASYTLTGTAATLVRGYNLDAQPGSYTVTGTAATLARGLVVNAAPGSFAVTGTAATLEYTVPGVYTLDAQPGAYALTGVAATLTYTPLNAYTLDAQPGSYTITGIAAELTYAGASIWTDVGVSAATWSDVGGATSIWTDL